MKVCDYCGKENGDAVVFCGGCGTELAEPVESQPENLPDKAKPRKSWSGELNARSATIVLLSYLGVPFFIGIIAGLLVAILVLLKGVDPDSVMAAIGRLAPMMAVLFMALSYMTIVLTSVALVPTRIHDTSPAGAAWIVGPWRAVGKGLVIGCIVAVCVYILNTVLKYPAPASKLGAFDQMAFKPGFSQAVWMVTVILLGPPFEELLFRGMLYGGYRKSVGPAWAAALTTAIFVLMHSPRVFRYPPYIAGVAGMALAALWCRLRWKAIGPAIAVHVAYNAVVTVFWVYPTWQW